MRAAAVACEGSVSQSPKQESVTMRFLVGAHKQANTELYSRTARQSMYHGSPLLPGWEFIAEIS